MTSRDFKRELQREDDARQVPPQSLVRVRARLDESIQGERPFAWGKVLVPTLAVVALVVGGWWLTRAAPVSQLGAFELLASSGTPATAIEGEVLVVSSGEVTLRADDVTLENEGPVKLSRTGDGVVVRDGTVKVSVKKQKSKSVDVFVSHGRISVTGTRFTIVQRVNGGTVTLHEGAITFYGHGGSQRQLSPGESLTWPVNDYPRELPEPVVEPEPVPPPIVERPQAKRPDLESVLHEVDVLRSRDEFEGAAKVLADALRTQPKASRERLSFELGSLLTHQIKQKGRACAHWAAHTKQFPRGRYATEVGQASTDLGCRR